MKWDPIDRTIIHNLGFEDVSPHISKEYLRFCNEDVMNLHDLLRFPDAFSLGNQLIMNEEEVFLQGLFELVHWNDADLT